MISRDDPEYEGLREAALWNGIVPDRYPDAIARPSSGAEVAELVRTARERRLRIAIKSGGHNWRGAYLRDGGLLLDLGALNRIEVDAEQDKRARPRWSPGRPISSWPTPWSRTGSAFQSATARASASAATCWPAATAGTRASGAPRAGASRRSTPSGSTARSFGSTRASRTCSGPPAGAAAAFPAIAARFHLRVYPLPTIASVRSDYPLDRLPELLAWSEVSSNRPATRSR